VQGAASPQTSSRKSAQTICYAARATLPDVTARCASGPLAFRRPTAALAAPDASGIGSASVPRFLRRGFLGRYPWLPVSSLPRSAETGRSAGRSVSRSRPGTACETARGNRTCSTFWNASGMVPFDEQALIRKRVAKTETNVNVNVTHNDLAAAALWCGMTSLHGWSARYFSVILPISKFWLQRFSFWE
jgi:hypothetical protein